MIEPITARPQVRVGLVQINNSYSNQNYLPLSVGLLQAYCLKHLKEPQAVEFLLPVYSRLPVDQVVRQVRDADVAFFSTYVWNFRISLESARRLKEERPDLLIVFGGPHVPDHGVEEFHRRYPFIDLACHGEGEAVACSILENFRDRSWHKVPSISYVDEKGHLKENPRAARIPDMALVPSPYLEGIFEPLMKAHSQEHWIALWETNRGCPFSCLPGETLILTEDLRWKRLDRIRRGEGVVGIVDRKGERTRYCPGKVNRVYPVHEEEIFRITTQHGSIEATADHPFLTTHRRWRSVKQLRPGTFLRFLSPPLESSVETQDYRQGYIWGALRGDGCFKKYPRGKRGTYYRYWCGLVGDDEMMDAVLSYSQELGVPMHVAAFQGGRYASRTRIVKTNKRANFETIETWSQNRTPEFIRGFLAGFYDADGSWTSALRFHGIDQELLELVEGYLNEQHFLAVREKKGLRLLGGVSEALRFITWSQPKVLRKHREWNRGMQVYNESPILSIEPVGRKKVYNLETTTGTYVADGFVVHNCTFCDWGSATAAKVYTFDLERLYREVEWFADRKIEYIFCCDANYGMLPRDLEITRYLAQTKKRRGYPHAVSVQNTKNATERAYEVQKTLSLAGMNKGVTIALQSIDPMTLKSIKRSNISTESYQELQRRFTRDGVETYTDMILGLPGETYDSFAEGISTVIANGQHNRIQYGNLSILPNAEMGDPEYQKRYGMVLVETKVINMHGSLAESDQGISETQQLVVGTHTLPMEDWVRTRAYAWWSAFLHFDKILQIPLILLHELCLVSYRQLLEVFSEGGAPEFPILREIQEFFLEQAREIQRGGSEFCESKDWLNIWWLTDEYMLIKLCVEGKLEAFYREAEEALRRFLGREGKELSEGLLHEAVEYNRALLKLPFQTEDLILPLSHNIWEFYRSVLEGRSQALVKKPTAVRIDRTRYRWSTWEDWFREVIWYGNKKGAYLYGNNKIEPQMAGHY